jgi:hypothetical protein
MVDENKVAVIMCTWRRIGRLQHTINMLLKQNNKHFDLYIWNNNIKIIFEINQIIAEYPWISVHHSPKNIGGIGRFHYAHNISNSYDKVLFIDDDQDFSVNLIKNAHEQFEPKTLKSWWAWDIKDNYWNRTRILKQNTVEPIYCGTGGMIIDSELFKNNNVFTSCPINYKFIEDLWLSFYAKNVFNYKLDYFNSDIKIIIDNKDQYVKLKNKKGELYKILKNNNWNEK